MKDKMSTNYFVDITIVANFQNKTNILKILDEGTKINFIYYDYTTGTSYEDSPTLNSKQVYDRILQNMQSSPNETPTVYVRISNDSCAFLSFFANNNLLKCSLYGMTNISKKEFEENHYDVDFSVYIKIMLNLCKLFAIKSIELGEF